MTTEEKLSETSAIVLAKSVFASTMSHRALKRCTLPVLKLAAQMRTVGLGAETYRRLSSAGLIAWARVGGWRATDTGIEALTKYIDGPVFAE